MKKLFLFPIIFFLIIFSNAKADLRESYNKKESLTKTTCSWDNAQFNKVNYDDGSTNLEERICVDKNKGTIFYITRGMDEKDLDRSWGFLDKKEINAFEMGSLYKGWIQQWSIEGDSLFEYGCDTFRKYDTSCENGIQKILRGRKR